MHSRIDTRRAIVLVLASLTWLLAAAPPPAAPAPASAPGSTPTREEIVRAIEAVKADPNLSLERTIKTLRWKNSSTTKVEEQKKPAGGITWIGGAIRWFNQSARILVWVAAALLVAFLAVYILRLLGRLPRASRTKDDFVAPTHVRNLDIRPETLPADIGAAARALWDDGEQRAALALLYRGMLSRLAHVHRVPIRDSSTEGDCLALAARHLTQQPKRDYASTLVRVWQRAVYGREDVQTSTVYTLCDGFAPALDAGDAIDAGGAA